ncbi:MAG: tetratricopeptide repeat protein, partial [Gammaproteobacteria bacterium]|nr:tetratricopeptide repeat protein [Gammaproteobacteria bacterium]
ELFEKTTRTRPGFVDAYINLGLQYMQKKELDKADQAFSKAIKLDVTNHIAYNHRGIIMRMRGDFTAAKEMYQLALKYDPNNVNVHLNVAILYDIYLYEPDLALYYYKQYQLLTGESDKLVGKWIVDLERRVTAKQ